ncbi:MAG: phosphotransferase [Deinococcales bacterium]
MSAGRVPDAYLARIRHAFPERSRARFELIDEGAVNDVVIVDGELVCRFPKRDVPEEGVEREGRALALVARHVRAPVPRYEVVDSGFAAYQRLAGGSLTRDRLRALAPADRAAVLRDLVTFLAELHAVPAEEAETVGVGASPTVRDRPWWLAFLERVRERVAPYLVAHQRDWLERWFEPVLSGELLFDDAPRLVHGDLAPDHLLVEASAPRLSGVLDFGTAGLGDPAVDLAALLYHYGESLVAPVLVDAPDLTACLPRARFWAGTLELQWALAALERGDRGLGVAHIGSARDLGHPSARG